jgi:hypothetical protein
MTTVPVDSRIEALGRASRRAAVVGFLGLILVLATLINAYVQLTRLQREKEAVRRQLNTTRDSLRTLEQALSSAADLERYKHPVTFVTAKSLATANPEAARLLEDILDKQRVPWRLGGAAEYEGFDSPGFAAFVLSRSSQSSRLPRAPAGASTREALLRAFPAADTPSPGDLVFYPAGFVLFYFPDEHHRPFVIGMTPFGVTALDYTFAKPTDIRNVF